MRKHHTGNQISTWRPEILVDCEEISTRYSVRMQRPGPAFSAANYHDMIDGKVSDIRNAAASADQPTFVANSSSSFLTRLEEACLDDVIAVITTSPSKQCDSDRLPTWLLKTCSPLLTQYIPQFVAFCRPISCCLEECQF